LRAVPCVLRIGGDQLDADALQRATSLAVYRVDRKGDPRRLPTRGHFETSVVHIDVSDAPFSDLNRQAAEALDFLRTNADPLTAAIRFPGVEWATLDFGVEARDVAIDSHYLPPDLLRSAGQLGVGIEISSYPTAE
jgi:hypothetical protein